MYNFLQRGNEFSLVLGNNEDYENLESGMPFERIKTVFKEEGIEQRTLLTSTKSPLFGGRLCGFTLHLDIAHILHRMRTPLIKRSKETDVLIDLDCGVSYVHERDQRNYGNGEYKVKIDDSDPPSPFKVSDLLQSVKIDICLSKVVSPGVYQHEIVETMSPKRFLMRLRFKLVHAANPWPPSQSILKSKLTLVKNCEGVIKFEDLTYQQSSSKKRTPIGRILEKYAS